MKKLDYRWLFIAISLHLYGCSETIVEENSYIQYSEQKDIDVSIPLVECGSHSDTRIDISSSMQVTWGANDTLGIFPDKGDQLYFALNTGAGNMNAVFSGGSWGLKKQGNYYAYFPFNRALYQDEQYRKHIPISLFGQIQDGDNSTKHLSQFDYLAAKGTISDEGKINFSMQHLVTFIKLELAVPIDGQLTSVEFGCSDAVFIRKGEVDLTSNELKINPLTYTNQIMLKCTNMQVKANEKFTVWMVAAPFDMAGKSCKIRCRLDGIDECYQTTIEVDKNWKAGYYYQYGSTSLYKYPDEYANWSWSGNRNTMDEEDKYFIRKVTQVSDPNKNTFKLLRDMCLNGVLESVEFGDLTSNDGISDSAFYGCTRLKSVLIASSISHRVGSYAFANSGVEEVELSSNTYAIGNGAFANTKSLKKISSLYLSSIGDYAFKGSGIESAIFRSYDLKTIGSGAFEQCQNLKSAEIDGGRTDLDFILGENLFYGCSSLTSVKLPNHVKVLPKNVLGSCKALAEFTIPKSCATIGESALYNTSVTEIDVPDKCVFIDKYALYSVKTLHMTSSVSYISNSALSTTGLKVYLNEPVPSEMTYNGLNLQGTSVELHVPAGTKESYHSSKSWNNVTNIIDDL